jgi:hypothetical protein
MGTHVRQFFPVFSERQRRHFFALFLRFELGNPLPNLNALQKIKDVMKAGQPIDLKTL